METEFTAKVIPSMESRISEIVGNDVTHASLEHPFYHKGNRKRIDNLFRGPNDYVCFVETQYGVSDEAHLAQIRIKLLRDEASPLQCNSIMWLAEGFREAHFKAIDKLRQKHPGQSIHLGILNSDGKGGFDIQRVRQDDLLSDPLIEDFRTMLAPNVIETLAVDGIELARKPLPRLRRNGARNLHLLVKDMPDMTLNFFASKNVDRKVGLYREVTDSNHAELEQWFHKFKGDPRFKLRRPERRGRLGPATVSICRTISETSAKMDEGLERFYIEGARSLLDIVLNGATLVLPDDAAEQKRAALTLDDWMRTS